MKIEILADGTILCGDINKLLHKISKLVEQFISQVGTQEVTSRCIDTYSIISALKVIKCEFMGTLLASKLDQNGAQKETPFETNFSTTLQATKNLDDVLATFRLSEIVLRVLLFVPYHESGGACTTIRLLLGKRQDWKQLTTSKRPKMRQLMAAKAKVV